MNNCVKNQSKLTAVLAVIIKALIQVRYGLDSGVYQIQIRHQSVCQGLLGLAAASQTNQ